MRIFFSFHYTEDPWQARHVEATGFIDDDELDRMGERDLSSIYTRSEEGVAKDLKIPLKAGISGTNHRFMNQVSLMGGDVYGSRAAILGHLVRINAHSFHEVCVEAEQHAPEYKPDRDVSFRLLKKASLPPLAAEVGVMDPGDPDISLGLKGLPGRGT